VEEEVTQSIANRWVCRSTLRLR